MENFILSVHAQKVIYERKIKLEWIESTFKNPDKVEVNLKNFEIEHKLKIIKENDSKVLRVIYNKSVNPIIIVTSFFDRRMKGKLL